MSVNFYKHRDQLVDAYKDVMNDKTKTNWALFGYEKQTNDLMLVDKGDGGLEQLADEFNSGKILYAFCKVIDPNNDLPKYILVNWQGEGAPLQRKGVCMNHFRDISGFFKGAHLTLNARTEEDVEPSLIMSKISKVSARVNVKDRVDTTENVGPVGSNYKRVQPEREINMGDREKFWSQSQQDEQRRIAEEKKRLTEERVKIERERKEREILDAKKREQLVREKEREISKLREAQKNSENSIKNDLARQSSNNVDLDDNERRNRSQSTRRERNEEAKSVISHESIKSARAMFEQNSSAGQMNSLRSNSIKNEPNKPKIHEVVKPKEVPILRCGTVAPKEMIEEDTRRYNQEKAERERTERERAERERAERERAERERAERERAERERAERERAERERAEREKAEQEAVVQKQQEITNDINKSDDLKIMQNEQYSSIKKEPLVATKKEEEETEKQEGLNNRQNLDSYVDRYVESYIESEPLEDIAEEEHEQNWDDGNDHAKQEENSEPRQYELKTARALYDYQAADDTEISFDPDDIITHIEQIDEGWWQGMAPDGTYGLFPANYVELIDD